MDYAGFAQLCGRSHNRIIQRSLAYSCRISYSEAASPCRRQLCDADAPPPGRGSGVDCDVRMSACVLCLPARTRISRTAHQSGVIHTLYHVSHFFHVADCWRLFRDTTSSIKPDVHNISQRRQRDDRVTTMGNVRRQFGDALMCGSRDTRANRQI